MAADRRYAAERLGHDAYAEMAVARRRPRMAGMQVTLVLDGQECRRETALQALAQALFTASLRFAAGAYLIHGLALIRLRRLGLAAQPQDLRYREDQHRHRDAEHLEIDPDTLGKVPRYIDIGGRQEGEPENPQGIDQ